MRRTAILIAFSVKSSKFNTVYERNKFFKCLYGWKQTIKKGGKTYTYRRCGLLDRIPHLRVDESVFIIARQHLEEIKRFLDEWRDKVVWEMFDVLLDEDKFEKLFEVIE